ncbi:hypothetical protein COLO4_37212 [Corchorus olitorius]|uniref:Uncharacterized protein n=1 Tax=Corchorus olitorius TaxID=93759 RepID=A0A1R3G2Y4_9ROSI|nr:hypothetical protein COLO4_37212 [Corchorus olitorius]
MADVVLVQSDKDSPSCIRGGWSAARQRNHLISRDSNSKHQVFIDQTR